MVISGDYLVFSELEGTITNRERGSWNAIKPALEVLKRRGVPLVLCTNKTQAEVEMWRKRMGVKDPFICENGGAIYIPMDYFEFSFYDAVQDEEAGYDIIEFGESYEELVKVIRDIKNLTGLQIRNFSDMTPEDIAKAADIPQKDAEMAKNRKHDEAFLVEGEISKEQLGHIKQIVEERNLRYYQGRRFHHLSGKHDKGDALSLLKRIYRKAHPKIKAVCVGSHVSDERMLRNAEIPILVKDESGGHAEIEIPNLKLAKAKGPDGWAREIGKIIKDKK